MHTACLSTLNARGPLSSPRIRSAAVSQRRVACKRSLTGATGYQRMLPTASHKKNGPTVKAASDDPSPFFEPLVRSFLLGIGAGAIVEILHVTMQLSGFAMNLGYQQLVEALPSLMDELAPVLVLDHLAAAGSWIVFYVIEAIAIVAILDRYPNDNDSQKQAIKKLTTLPQRMLPIKLQFAKALLGASYKLRPSQATANATVTDFPAPPVTSTKAMTTSQFVDSSTTTLTPPSVVKDDPFIQSVLAPAPPAAPKPSKAPRPPKAPKPRAPRRNSLKPGQWDPTARQTLSRTMELADRKAFLKNFWYAAAFSHQLQDKPVGVDILGMRIVLFRDSNGQVHCLQDACPHRGAPLSEGWVEQTNGHDCVVCPYHGWAFDGSGKLRDVPSLETPGKWPKRALIDTFPVVEKGGFIWLFYGSEGLPADERPPIPYCPELDDPKWQPVYGEMEFECGHWAVFENAIDMAHIHYLHGDTFGNKDNPKLHGMQVSRDAYGISANFSIHNSVVSPLWDWTKVDVVPVMAQAMLPSTSSVRIQLGAGVSMITFVNTVPINSDRSVNRFCLIRNFAGWEGFDRWAECAMYRILGEDKVMVEKLRPELVKAEVSLEVDMPQIAFRKLRQEYINMGYGVPPAASTKAASSRDMDM